MAVDVCPSMGKFGGNHIFAVRLKRDGEPGKPYHRDGNMLASPRPIHDHFLFRIDCVPITDAYVACITLSVLEYRVRDVLSTVGLADSMQAILPEGLLALSSIVRNWTFSLFYLMSNLWGSVVVSVLVSFVIYCMQ